MDWIRKQAIFYQSLAQSKRYQAVVHLENQADESFWNYQLQSVKTGRYLFLYFSKNDKGIDSRGCEQCLKFKPYLTSRFFICIDSDLRLLRGDQGLEASNNIAQTYAYSWENHLCEANHLSERFKQLLPNSHFDFQLFLHSLSEILYRPLLFLIKYGADTHTNQRWNVSRFNACIPLQPSRKDLECNGKGYLEKLESNFDKAWELLPHEDDCAIPSIAKSNAYLHIQGHQLYKLVMHIGTMLCRGTDIAFKTDILDKGLHTSGYHEIESLQADLRYIL